jgi:hypothetical protein
MEEAIMKYRGTGIRFEASGWKEVLSGNINKSLTTDFCQRYIVSVLKAASD